METIEDQNLVEKREEYCANHSLLPKSDILAQIENHTYENHQRPHLISGYLQGAFLSFISKLLRPKRILEIGTYTAYSTVCLAEGLNNSGQIISLEIDKALKPTIDKNLELAKISHQCQVIYGDAEEGLMQIEGEFDLIFIDAAKKRYQEYTEICLRLISDTGLIIIDNVLFKNDVIDPPKKAKICKSVNKFNKWVHQLPGVQQVMLPIRDGITLLQKDGKS